MLVFLMFKIIFDMQDVKLEECLILKKTFMIFPDYMEQSQYSRFINIQVKEDALLYVMVIDSDK